MTDNYGKRDVPPFMFAHWDYLAPLKKHSSFVYVFVLAAVLSALALTYIYSEKYQATVTLVFTPGKTTTLQFRGSNFEALGSPTPATEFKVIGKTLQELAGNEALLRAVVKKHQLDVEPETVYDGPWYVRYYNMAKDYSKEYGVKAWNYLKYGRLPDEDPTADAVRHLAKDTKIENKDSYVFRVKILDIHPKRAAAVADTMAEELVALASESNKSPARIRIGELAAMAAIKREEISEYQLTTNNALRKYNVASASQELEEGLQKLYDLQAEQLRLEAQIRGTERTIAALKDVEARGSKRRPAGNRPSVSERLQSKDMTKVISDKLFSEVELAGLRARDRSLRQSIGKLAARLKLLPELKLEIDQLESDLARANKEYELINIALNELTLGQSEKMNELRILHRASIPTSPVTPIKIYHVALAAVLGLCIAIGLVYVLTYFNVRLFVPSRGYKGRQASAEKGDNDAAVARATTAEGSGEPVSNLSDTTKFGSVEKTAPSADRGRS